MRLRLLLITGTKKWPQSNLMRNCVMFELVFNLRWRKKKHFLGMDGGWNPNSQAIIPQKISLQRKLKQNVESELSPCTEQMLANRSCLPEEVTIGTEVCWSVFHCRYLAFYYRFVYYKYIKKKLAIVLLLGAANVISGNNGNFQIYGSLLSWVRKKRWRNNNARPLQTYLETIII